MEYTKVDLNNEAERAKVMGNLLRVWDNNCIYICHPNHISFTEDNWDDIDPEKMLKENDYRIFHTFGSNEAFKYLYRRMAHDVNKQIDEKGKENALSLLAVVEGYRYNGEDNFLLRAIVRGDASGMSICFNPEFEETIPKSYAEQWLRLDGDEDSLPDIYKKSRKRR